MIIHFERRFTMKIKHFIPLSMAAITIMTATIPVTTALASTGTNYATVFKTDEKPVTHRYSYVMSIDTGVYPSASGTEYDLNIQGPNLVSVSGTAVLYKQSTSGTYTKIDSEFLELEGNAIRYTGYLKSSGSGKYKIEFKGTAYAADGSESISIRNYGSY